MAVPVLDWLASHGGRTGRVAWIGPVGAYVHFDRFVLAVGAAGVPRMPNGIELLGGLPRGVRLGQPARVDEDSLEIDDVIAIHLGGDLWEPRPRGVVSRARAGERGDAILRSLGVRPGGSEGSLASAIIRRSQLGNEPAAREGVAALVGWLSSRCETQARLAAACLLGRGPGATPVGDDLLAGTAFVCAVLDPASASTRLLCPPDVHSRTTSLSATLLGLAVQGQVVEPAASLLNASGYEPVSLDGLTRLGGSTGNAYALAIGTALACIEAEG